MTTRKITKNAIFTNVSDRHPFEAYLLTEHSLRATKHRIVDRLVRRNEEKSVNKMLHSMLSGLKFSGDFEIDSTSPDNFNLSPEIFDTSGLVTQKKKIQPVNLERVLDNHSSWNLGKSRKKISVAPKFKRKKCIKSSPKPKMNQGKKDLLEIEPYENNWDLHLINKMSQNVAKWIVHEKLKEPKDEEDMKQKQKLTQLVNIKYGTVPINENVELIPEDISETDIREFHENCLEIGIDLERLERVPKPEVISKEDRITLGQFVAHHNPRIEELLAKTSEIKRLSMNRSSLTAKPFKNTVLHTKDLCNPKLNKNYHFVSDNEYEMKLINGEKIRYDQKIPEKNVLTLPERNERYRVTWQEVYPSKVNLQRGIHRGLVRWDAKPHLMSSHANAIKSVNEQSLDHVSKNSIEKDFNECLEEPVIQIACIDWQNEWGVAQHWRDLSFRNIRQKLKSIQATDREEALFAIALAVIFARATRGIQNQSPVVLPQGILDKVISLLDDSELRNQIIAGIILHTTPLDGYQARVSSIISSALETDLEFPDRVLVSIVATLYGLEVNNKTCEALLVKYFIEPADYLLNLMQSVADRNTDLMHSVTAEYLNSGTCEERSGACTILGKLNQNHLTAPMMQKIIWIAWNDKNYEVKKSATRALSRILTNEKTMELVHNQLISDLENDETIVKGLDMVAQLNFVTDRLHNLLLKCFKHDRGVVRSKICETVTKMKLFNEEIIRNILQLMQFEIIAEIKCAAIGALIELENVSEEIVQALAWAVRFEDAPTCRYQAAKAILNLELFDYKNVVETVRERIVVEDDETVQTVLVEILGQLNLTVDQVLEQHPLLTRIKTDIKHLCQKQNVIDLIVLNK